MDDWPSKYTCTLQVLEAHLVHRMAQLPELVDPGSGLHIGVVARPDGTHAGGLVPSVALSAVLKVRVWPARAVDTYVACCGYVGASVGLGHDSHHGNA